MPADFQAHRWYRAPALLSFLLAWLAVLGCLSAVAQQSGPAPRVQTAAPRVLVLHLDDTIQPVSEQYLSRGLDQAASQHADLVLVELNTPGGLLTSTRAMVHAILDSPTPVIVYVTPSGSRAGSAGFFLLEAADIAAMAPGTNAGAAHPVVEGGTLDPIMKQKLENDTTAFLRSYVSRRQRNVEAAEDAVLHSRSYSDSEALKLNLLTLVAADETTLLNSLDGHTVTRFGGATTQLRTRNAILIAVEPTTRERILDRLMDPNLALLCMILGLLLIYLEFNVPGTIIPGAIGTLLLLTSLFALNLLPVRLTSVMLLVAAMALLLLEAKFPSHGVLATTGIICLVMGGLTLVAGPIPEQRIHLATAAGTGLGFGIITVFLVRIAWRARRNKVLTGPEAMVGAIAVAQQSFHQQGEPRSQVMVHGELWLAESPQPLSPGERARVIGVRGLTLLVQRIPGGP
ncbi:MAG TPA: nodulation protein NfeD [Acidobacteriaceae bacterium]